MPQATQPIRFPGRRATINAPTIAKASAKSGLRRIHQPLVTCRIAEGIRETGVAPWKALPAMKRARVTITLVQASHTERRRAVWTIGRSEEGRGGKECS